jgi:hypothetical protein
MLKVPGAHKGGQSNMKLLVIVLNKVEVFDKLMEEFGENKISGATIIDSMGMMHIFSDNENLDFFGSLRKVLNPAHKENKTIFMVVDEKQIPVISKILNKVTGGLDKPDTGIMFAVPVDYKEGLYED